MALIAVVDDEKDACGLMRRILSAMGHQVEAFTAAGETISWLKGHIPDLILLDIRLRDCQGLQFLEFLRQSHPGVKVMVVTGSPSFETAERALALGAEDYLVKPLEIADLEERVNKALGLIFEGSSGLSTPVR